MLGWIRVEPLIAVLLWSGIFVTVKLGLREIPFLSFTALRLAIAAVLLLTLAGLARALILKDLPWRLALLAGLPQMLFQVLLFWSLVFTSASNSALLFSTSPILLALGEWLVHRRRPPSRRAVGLVLGLIGVGLVVQPSSAEPAVNHVIGGLLAIAAAAAWAWYGVAVQPLVKQVGSIPSTGLAVAAGALYLLPFAGPELTTITWTSITSVGWLSLLYNAVLGSVVAMSLWGRSLHLIGSARTMAYTYLEPPAAVILAALILNERLEVIAGLGAALILLALWLSR